MIETSRRILKSGDVELNGQCRLGLSPDRFEASGHEHIGSITAAPKARVLENHPEYAVIEVSCSCGAKICLRCEYSACERSENP